MSSRVPEDDEVWRIQFKDELPGRSYIDREDRPNGCGLSDLFGI